MFYISSRLENGLVGITDTKDNVEEFYTVAQVKSIVKDMGIAVNGARINSQGRIRLQIFDIEAYKIEQMGIVDKAKYNMNFGSATERFMFDSYRGGGTSFNCDAYADLLWRKSHIKNPDMVSSYAGSLSWRPGYVPRGNGCYGGMGGLAATGAIDVVEVLFWFAEKGAIADWRSADNFKLPSFSKFMIPATASVVFNYSNLISSFSGGQTIWFNNPLLDEVDRFLSFVSLVDYNDISVRGRKNIAKGMVKEFKINPTKKFTRETMMLDFSDALVNNLRLSNTAPTLFVDNPDYYIWGRNYSLATPLNSKKVTYSFNNVDLRGKVILGSATNYIKASFNYTSVEELYFSKGIIESFEDCFNNNPRLKKVVFEEGFILAAVYEEVFRNCPNAKFYVPSSLKNCASFGRFSLDNSQVIFTS